MTEHRSEAEERRSDKHSSQAGMATIRRMVAQ